LPREDAATKGRRLLGEGRLRVLSITTRELQAECWGDSAELYTVGYRPGGWYCSCPAFGRCSHMTALMLVTSRPST
jgi:uncharacterized Zn finger protein